MNLISKAIWTLTIMHLCVCASHEQRVLTHSFRSFARYWMGANLEHIIQIFIIECVALFICLYSSNITMAGKKSLLYARPFTTLTLTLTVISVAHFKLTVYLFLSSNGGDERASEAKNMCELWLCVAEFLPLTEGMSGFLFYFRRSRSYLLSEHVTVFEYISAIMQGMKKSKQASNSRSSSSFDNTIGRPVYTNVSHLFSIYCVNTLCQIKVHYLFIKALSMK